MGHTGNKQYQMMEVQRIQHAAAVAAAALQETFTAYREALDRVEIFKYLGRGILFKDKDEKAIRTNIQKARGV